MGNLRGRGLGSRLTPLPRRMKSIPQADAQARRSESWYGTARWQALRLVVLQRDQYICQQTGVLLCGKYPAPNSPVVDHIEPHRGDPDLFWDVSNLQAVSKEYHDRTKQSLEKRGLA